MNFSTEGPGEPYKDTWFVQGRWTRAGRGRDRSSEKCWVLGSVRMTWGPKCLGIDCWGVSEVKLWAESKGVHSCRARPSLVQSVLPYQVPVPPETSSVLAMNGLQADLGGSCFCLHPGVKGSILQALPQKIKWQNKDPGAGLKPSHNDLSGEVKSLHWNEIIRVCHYAQLFYRVRVLTHVWWALMP